MNFYIQFKDIDGNIRGASIAGTGLHTQAEARTIVEAPRGQGGFGLKAQTWEIITEEQFAELHKPTLEEQIAALEAAYEEELRKIRDDVTTADALGDDAKKKRLRQDYAEKLTEMKTAVTTLIGGQ